MPCCHLCTCDGRVHCWIAFIALVMVEHFIWVGLSAALPKSYVHCCSFAEINCFLYDFAVCRRAAELLLTVDDYISATSHRPHIGHQFSVVMGFKLSPLEGVASRALGLRWQTETKAIDVVRWIFIVLNQGMVQKTLKYNSTWVEGKEGRKLYKKGTHYEAMMNDTWAIKHEILN